MTPRERFRETMRYGRPDRVPYLEEGLREEVLARWRREGLRDEQELAERFRYDRRERIGVDLGFRPRLRKWPKSRRGLKALRLRLNPDDPQRLPQDWSGLVKAWARREHLLELPIHSGFFLSLGVDDWSRLEELLCQVADRPDVVSEIVDARGRLAAGMARRILSEVEADFATVSEPIAGASGPVISPETYERIVLPGYAPILEVLRAGGVETIVLVTYANPRPLLPAVVSAGFNCLWACEAPPGAMDYRDLRRQFGRRLRLIGGIDLDALLSGKPAIRRELLTKVPPLLAEGGYIPLTDGRVRGNVPFDDYAYYRRLLEDLTRG